MPEQIFTREIELRAAEAEGELIPCVLTTEAPVERGNYVEVLSCRPGDVDLSRAPLPLIVQHDRNLLNIGLIEQVRLVGGKLKGLARFGASTQAREILADVKAGIVRSLSVGYQLTKTLEETGRTVRFAWMPYEASVVSVPADPNAGFYRSMKGTQMENFDNTIPDNKSPTRSQRIGSRNAAEDERERCMEIVAIGQAHGMAALAQRAINDGTPLDDFRNIVLRSISSIGTLRASESPELGLTRRELEQYSFRKAILAQMDPQFARSEAGFEMEVSRAFAQKTARVPRGLLVPPEVMMARRDMVVGTPTAGGYLVGTDHMPNDFIDLMRERSLVMALGAKELNDLNGNITIPKKTGSGTTYWLAEGDAPTESAMTIGQVPMSPKTVGGFTDFSRRMLLQATPDIEMLIRQDFASVIALELDRVAIQGTGTNNQPTGILNTSGIGSVVIGANGGAITWSHILQLEEALATANADLASVAYLTTQKARRAMKATTKVSADAGAGFIWENGREPGFGLVNGYRAAGSTNVPSNLVKGSSGAVCSAVIAGDFSQLLIGRWGGLDIILDPYTGSTSGTRRVVALLDCDMAVRQAAAFAAIKDATT